MNKYLYIVLILILVALQTVLSQRSRPQMVITAKDTKLIRESLGKYPIFDNVYNEAKARIEKALNSPIDVPIPKDAGGYTHEKHKQNYVEMQTAGILYAVTKDERYAQFIRDMLLQYAELYPTLQAHPMAANEKAGKLFWQTLNETVWLVHAAQAYDCIYNWLTEKDRNIIESKILLPLANSLSDESLIDHIHNHGTWACAAIGMAGYAMNNKDLVEKALYGFKKDKKGGFLRQLELLFSPDGYYTEGPYYIRYALMPFYYFAQAVENNQPEVKIFDFRNQILKQAFYSALQLTYTNGAFLPFNDALKEKNFLSYEIVVALNIAYRQYGFDESLLDIAQKQNTVILNGAGLKVAQDLTRIKNPEPFNWKSIEFTDGPDGTKGGLGILRSGSNLDQSLLLMKYTSHGLSHGHYDKLGFLYYDGGKEIIQDYGSVRFINVEPKFGGRYLPENKSFAMQTIAHNTVTVDEQSHYQGKMSVSEQYHPTRHFYSTNDSNIQVMSAKASNVYKGVEFQRTMAMVKDDNFSKPIILDIFKVESKAIHQYDLPFYYMGHLIYTNFRYKSYDKERVALGKANGYQHLWKEAEGYTDGVAKISWLQGNRYYSLISSVDSTTNITFVRIGAGDPYFNLRNEPAIILRKKTDSHVFASVIEPHGVWDGTKELSKDASGIITAIKVIVSNEDATVVEISGEKNINWVFAVTNRKEFENVSHKIEVEGKIYEWIGPFKLIKK